ncbi:hypothetical protein M404DRAFT_83116, partial [Pisolithus tinctorius Marx 270]
YGFDPAPYPTGQPPQESLAGDRLEQLAANRDAAIIAHKEAQELMKSRSKGTYMEFSVGDKVWLDASDLKRDVPSRKLVPRRHGPFVVSERISLVAYKLELPPNWRIHPVFHASKLTPFIETREYGLAQPPPPPELVGDENEWEVEAILKHKRARKPKYLYLVKWLGYPHSQNSWEGEENLINAPEVLAEYKRVHSL